MKTDKLILELEQLIEQSGYTIRRERGTFKGDHCIVEGRKLVMINKKRPPQLQVGILARVLKKLEMQDIYIKPAVRRELEELWERFEKFDEQEPEEEIDIDLDQ